MRRPWRSILKEDGSIEMEDSRGNSSSPAPFLSKTYEMVDDPSTDSIVSWNSADSSFVVWNQTEFSRDLLPRYFKHNNFSSFVRQLNTYGFRKIDPEHWEFANDYFVRGQKHLLKNIYRRKPVYSHSLHSKGNSSGPQLEGEKQEREEEIERLKQEKRKLWNEIQKHTQKQHGMESRMLSLEEKLQVLVNRQRGLMAFLSQIIGKPGLLSNFAQHSDHSSKKRRHPKINYFNEHMYMEDDHTEPFQSSAREQKFDMEPLEKMESSLNSLENFFSGVSQTSGEDMSYDSIMPCLPASVSYPDINVSSGGIDSNLQLLKLHHSSPCPGDIHSSPEIAESASCGDTPVSVPDKREDSPSKFSEIDVNSEPASTEIDSRDRNTGTTASTVPTGVNDVFWEQFLTEIPGSSDMKEVQSTRSDSVDRQSGWKLENEKTTLCNRDNVNNLAEKMENLTSAEKT